MTTSRRTALAVLLLAAVPAAPLLAQSAADDEAEIRRVIEEAYVNGIHIARDSAAVRRGFHPRFVMSVLQGDRVTNVTLDTWLARMSYGQRNPDRVTFTFDRVDVVGNTAHARLRLFVNGRQRFTDMMGLYRFPEGWRIVNKVFESHQ